MSRRRLLELGAALGLAGIATACGTRSPNDGTVGSELGVEGDLQIVKRWPRTGLVPGDVRLPVSLADARGILGNDDARKFPRTLTANVVDPSSGEILSTVVAERHGDDLSVPYWPVVVGVTAAGIYVLRIDEAPGAEASFQIDDPSTVAMPVPGGKLPPFDTPTVTDARGVSPICTRSPEPCPFHEVTLTEALSRNVPVAYLVGTPAHCTTGTCAPALESMIVVADSIGGRAAFVHADIYADDEATMIAPAVTSLKMEFEPALFVTDADGTIVQRLDAVFDADEIRAALAAAGLD